MTTKAQRSAMAQLRTAKYNREHVRYCIRYQYRKPGGCAPGDNPRDPRSWRVYAVLPLLFHSEAEARLYLDAVDAFKNMRHLIKVSCSVERRVIR